jgi:hypothetical protein
MPDATSNVDRRRHGRGNNISGKVAGKANLQDQRTKVKYAPKIASASSEFAAGAAAGRPKASMGKPPARSAPRPTKLGGSA